MQTIPEYDGIKPYMQIRFQYSLHIQQSAGGVLNHKEFLAQAGVDPRRALADQLCADIPADCRVLAYNMSFEKGVIKNLAEAFPDLSAHLMTIHDNIRDLITPFKDKLCCTQAMKGESSIKCVLPALCPNDPELDYNGLVGVHNGNEAMNAFAKLPSLSPEDAAKCRANLLAYCRLDTLAMVKVLEVLIQMSIIP